MRNYLYFLIFMSNLLLSFVLAANKDPIQSLILFFILYIITSVVFIIDWVLTKPTTKSTISQTSEIILQENFHVMTQYGDRLMALAIIAVSNIIVYSMALSDSSIALIENELGVSLILMLVSIFIVPALLLKLNIEPKAKKIEGEMYTRIKNAIISNNIILPPEILPYIKSPNRTRTPIVNSNRTKTPESNLILHAYPSEKPISESEKLQSPNKLDYRNVVQETEDPRERLENAHRTFILSIFPELKVLLERRPVSIQNLFFYEVLNKVLTEEPECRTILGL